MFVVDTNAPGVVNLISPADGKMTNSVSIEFVWNSSSDSMSGITNYEIYITNNIGWTTNVITTGTNYSWSVGEGTNWWKVRAEDKAGHKGDWSSIRRVIVDTQPPVISLISPASNSTSGVVSVVFQWSISDNISGISNQRIEIDTNNNTGDGYEVVVYTNSGYTYTFSGNSTNHWRVWGIDRAGNTNYSSEWEIEINTNSPIANLIYPIDIETNSGGINFIWSCTSNQGGVSNIIQIGEASNFSSIDR